MEYVAGFSATGVSKSAQPYQTSTYFSWERKKHGVKAMWSGLDGQHYLPLLDNPRPVAEAEP